MRISKKDVKMEACGMIGERGLLRPSAPDIVVFERFKPQIANESKTMMVEINVGFGIASAR